MSKAFTYKSVGRMPVCKDCVGEVYNYYFEKYNDEKTSLYYMCRNLNICFDESCYNASIKETQKYPKKTIWKVYMTKLNSLGSNNNGAGDDFDSSDSFNAEERMKGQIHYYDKYDYNEDYILFRKANDNEIKWLDKHLKEYGRMYFDKEKKELIVRLVNGLTVYFPKVFMTKLKKIIARSITGTILSLLLILGKSQLLLSTLKGRMKFK